MKSEKKEKQWKKQKFEYPCLLKRIENNFDFVILASGNNHGTVVYGTLGYHASSYNYVDCPEKWALFGGELILSND